MWRSAEEKGLPVNFHIASGDLDPFSVGHPDNGPHDNYAAMGVSFFMANAKTSPWLITGGVCHRLPDLDIVSVESGIGSVPFGLAALDWQWQNCACRPAPQMTCCRARLPDRVHRTAIGLKNATPRRRVDQQQLGADNVLV